MSEVLARRGVAYRRLFAGVAAQFAVQGEFRHRAEQLLRIFFDDEDSNVRVQAADVFSSIDPRDFGRFKDLALSFVSSRAFSQDSSRFFSSLEGAECEIENVVIAASERLVSDIELNGNAGGRRSMDLHSLEDILRDQYASSEQDITHRKRILDVIDRMLSLELDGVDTVIRAHERGA
jgi:hypothetical protein